MPPKIKINAKEHFSHPFRVHNLLQDFDLEDVWRIPVKLSSEHNLELFIEQFTKSNESLFKNGLASLLFKFRLWVGNLLAWDEKIIQDKLIPGSLRHRYAKEEKLKWGDLPPPGTESFVPVYKLENEFLSEIDNKTVHAALHFSRVPMGGEIWTIHMAVYVKPKGWQGILYMKLIKPFRLWVVYPAMMKGARLRWENFLKSKLSPELNQ